MNKKSMYVSLAIIFIVIVAISAMAVPVSDDLKIVSGAAAILIPAVFVSVIGVMTLVGMNKTNSKGFDERMLKARGDAALNALVVTLVTALFIGFIDIFVDGKLPLTLFEASMISAMTGVGTFIILADMQDAYLGMKEKRKVSALSFGAVGLFIIVLVASSYRRTPKPDNIVCMLTMGIVWSAIAVEMFIKMACDKRAEKMETEDEES